MGRAACRGHQRSRPASPAFRPLPVQPSILVSWGLAIAVKADGGDCATTPPYCVHFQPLWGPALRPKTLVGGCLSDLQGRPAVLIPPVSGGFQGAVWPGALLSPPFPSAVTLQTFIVQRLCADADPKYPLDFCEVGVCSFSYTWIKKVPESFRNSLEVTQPVSDRSRTPVPEAACPCLLRPYLCWPEEYLCLGAGPGIR